MSHPATALSLPEALNPRAIQQALLNQGYDLGPRGADGVWGRGSIRALRCFQGDHGLKVDGIAGYETLKALPEVSARLNTDRVLVPVWYAEARRLSGLREVPGPGSNPTILGWARDLASRAGAWIGRAYRDDATPWCGLFAAHCLGATLPDEPLPANPLSALAWAGFGKAIPAGTLGAVCVFRRKGGGHVGFYAGEDETAIHVLGGNQRDRVGLARVAKARLVGFRWPVTAPAPAPGGVRRLAGHAPLSANEA